jgi:tetratricopeptide (TPR) repeat protein
MNDSDKNLSIENSKNSFWAEWSIILMVFLMPLFILPNIFELSVAKTIIFTSGILLAFIFFVTSYLKRNNFELRYDLFFISTLILGIFILISPLFVQNKSVSFLGSFWMDSSLNLAIFFFSIILISSIFKKVNAMLYIYYSFFLSLILVSIVHLINFLNPDLLYFLNFFESKITNTIGSFFDLGIIVTGLLFLSLISIEFLKITKKMKIVLGLVSLLSLFIIIIVGFKYLWIIILINTILIFSYYIFAKNLQGIKIALPKSILALLIISFIFAVASSNLTNQINEKLNINNSEILLTLKTTLNLNKDVLQTKPILGYGIGNFSEAWNKHKPAMINISDYWQLNYRSGFGFILSLPVSIGILGSVLFLFFFANYLILGFKTLFKKIEDETLKFLNISSFFISLYFWMILFVYNISLTNFVLTAVFTGIFVATTYHFGLFKSKTISLNNNPKFGFIYIFALVTILLVSVLTAYLYLEKFIASVYNRNAIMNFNSGEFSKASAQIINAIRFGKNEQYVYNYLDLLQNTLDRISNDQNLGEEERRAQISNILKQRNEVLNFVINLNPNNYLNYETRGEFFLSISAMNIDNLYELAKQDFEKALELSPNNPKLYLALARNEIQNNNFEKAEEYIGKALELKPNYVEAIFLFSRMQVLQGKIDEATINAEAALIVRPNDPFVYFELGLFNYQNKKYQNAINNFATVINLNPSFLNARYFLGLSLYQNGNTSQALEQFEILAQISPENQEVRNIIAEIKSGNVSKIQEQVETLPIAENDEENIETQ